MSQTHEGAMKINAKKTGLTLKQYKDKVESGFKYCWKCKSWKSFDQFGKDITRYDLKASKCFTCCRVKVRVSTKGRISTFKGKSHTLEAKQKMSIARKALMCNKNFVHPLKGKGHSLETRQKISQILRKSPNVRRGKDNPMFKDGKVAERRDQRFSAEYRRWRFDVFMRDKFTCQKCGDNRGGNLRAHHIKYFADFPELRFELSNGITWCNKCHNRHHYKEN